MSPVVRAVTPPSIADQIVWAVTFSPYFECVRRHESDNNGAHAPLYMNGVHAENPVSTASGHYQFLDSTWRGVWNTYARRPAPTGHAAAAPSYEQSLAAGIAFIKSGKSPWRLDPC